MAAQAGFLRFASPNERRVISREDLGLYHAVIVGAVYQFPGDVDVQRPSSFYHPLRRCIEQHPYFCVAIGDAHTEKPFYRRPPQIDLEQHVRIIPNDTMTKDSTKIENLLASDVDTSFAPEMPPWRATVLPLQEGCFIALSYSHSLGDGTTGMAFHRTFLSAWNGSANLTQSSESVINTPDRPLAPPFDTSQRLTISWSFLLGALLLDVLPTSVFDIMGLQRASAPVDEGTWTAKSISIEDGASYTKLRACEISAPTLQKALQACKKRDAKLTGLFLQLIARAMSKAFESSNVTNFVSQVPINMRHLAGVPRDESGNFVSTCSFGHPRVGSSGSLSDEDWAASARATQTLAQSASTLQDHSVGLLRYVSNIRKWTESKNGKRREASFELSNLGVFRCTSESSDMDQVKLVKMFFAQPGQATSEPLSFSSVTVAGGSLVYTVSWRAGALGVEDEDHFVDKICQSIEQDFQTLN